jgi:Phage tail lysozyme
LIGEAFIKVSPDTDGFAEELEAKVQEAADGAEAKVRIGGDDAALDETIADARAKLDELSGARAEATLAADDEDLDAKTDDARAKLDELDGKKATVTLLADDDDLDAKTDEAKAKTDELDGKTATAKLGLDTDDFDALLATAFADLAEMDTESATPLLGLDTTLFDAKMDAAEARLAAFKSQASSAGLGASGGAAAAAEGAGEAPEGSMIGAAILGAGALTPGVGAAAAGMGLLGGTGLLAFGGIAGALSAQHSASTSTGLTGAQLASTNYSNTVQVQQAQQQVSQARRQAAEDAITSDQAIAQADMNLAETERNASASQIQAVQAVAQAKQGVEQANYGLTEAEYNLGQAYISARENLQSLNDQLNDQKLNVKAASLAVQQAEYQQLLTDQNAYSTSLDKQQAALAVAQAQQQLTDATHQASDAQVAANLANKQGVDGSQTVIQAKQAVTSAQQAQQNSVQSLQDAQRNLTNTELNNADQVKAAQMQVAAAQRQAAYTQQQDAIAVAQAEQNVTDTIKEQQLQMKATASTANQAANQYALDMARLTPAGRDFVKSVEGLAPAYRGLEAVAQSTVLPGMTVFLNGIKGLLPEVSKGVGEMGSAMSQSFGQFGKQMQTPAFAKTLNGLITNGIQFANIVLPAFAQFIQELAIVGGKSGAVTALADVLAGIGNGLTGFTAALAPSIPAFNQIGEAVGKIAAAFGPALAQDIGLVAQLLRPIAALFNSKIGGPFVSGLAQVAAGFLTIKGLAFLLPGWITGPLSKLGGKVGDLLAGPFKAGWAKAQPIIEKGASQAASAITSGLSSAWSSVTTGFGQVFGEGGLVQTGWTTATGWASSFASSVGEQMSNAGSAIAGFASNMGSKMVSAGQSAVTFVSGLGGQLATAAKATWTWIAENSAAAATYIATNVAEAGAATAAFVAENAATLGLAAVLAGLVTGVVYLATHWKQAWDGMKDAVLFVYHDAIEPLGGWIMDAFQPVEKAALWLWHDVFDPMWHGIESGAAALVSGLSGAWGKIEQVFKTPVNFLINTVYDHGVRGFWNEIVGKVGLSGLELPFIAPLARGGVLPGYAPGHDVLPAMLSPGEAVLTPGATRAIGGAPVVNALNAAHQPSGGGGKPGHFSLGGIVSGAWDAATSAVSGLWDTGKAIAALATGNTTALINALGPILGTTASGDLAKVMLGIPKTLLGDMVHLVSGLLGAGGGSATSGALGSLPQNWHTIASYLAANGFSKYAAAGVAGNIEAESGGLPEQLEIGGGGGGGLIQWTPWQSYGPLITGNASQDLMTQLAAILTFGGGPSIVNRATSPSDAAMLYQDYYEKPANLSASLPIRMASANAVYQAMWGGGASSGRASGVASRYDSGGWLMPSTVPVNTTGQPEAVLTPQQSQALVTLAEHLNSSQGGTGAEGRPPVNIYFTGPQMPSQEQMAEIMRQVSLAAGG